MCTDLQSQRKACHSKENELFYLAVPKLAFNTVVGLTGGRSDTKPPTSPSITTVSTEAVCTLTTATLLDHHLEQHLLLSLRAEE